MSILGFLTTGDTLLGVVHIKVADRWLHIELAATILALGLTWPRPTADATAHVEIKKVV